MVSPDMVSPDTGSPSVGAPGMVLLVGLGNPGARYKNNRHNIGYVAVDAITHHYGFAPHPRKFNADLTTGVINGNKIMTLKPGTYMNRSGMAVQQAAAFYKPHDVIVIHDDIDLQAGKIRVKRGGGHGGHNGLRSIDAHMGRNYLRVRVGVGHPGVKDAVNPHVMGNFSRDDRAWVDSFITALPVHFPLLVAGDTGLFMTRMAVRDTPSRET